MAELMNICNQLMSAARMLAATFNALAITSGALLYGQTAPDHLGGNPIDYQTVYVTLPVFIVSIFATASFTWMVARHDQKRVKEIDHLAETIERLTVELESLKKAASKGTK